MLLPFGDRLLKYFPDPFDLEKIGAVAAKIIAERTKPSDNTKVHVSRLSQVMAENVIDTQHQLK